MMWLLLAMAVMISNPAPHRRLSGPPKLSRFPLLIVVVLLVVTQGVGIVLTTAMIGCTVFVAWRENRRRKARVAIAKSTATIVGHVLGDISAGSSMTAAVRDLVVTEDMPAEIAHTLTAARARTAGSAAHVLIDAPDSCPDLQHVGALWAVAERRGIALSALLEQSQRKIDATVRHAAATSASLQGPQATAVVLSLLPLAGIVMGTAMGADPAGFLFGGGLGSVLLILGVGLVCAGFLWVQALITKAAGVS